MNMQRMIDCASAFVLHSLIHCVLLATEGWNRPLATSWTMEHQREWLCVCVSVCEFLNCGGGGAEWCGFQLALKVKWYQNRLKEILVWCTNKAGKNKQRKKNSLLQYNAESRCKCLAPWDIKGMVHPNNNKTFPNSTDSFGLTCQCLRVYHRIIIMQWMTEILFPL